ncbi:methyltransferase [Geomonas sp. Red276]
MNLYERYCLPCLINLVCGSSLFFDLRAKVVCRAEGRVLEIGMGGGQNLPFYEMDKVDCVCGIEPSGLLRAKAGEVARSCRVPVEMVDAIAEKLPLESDSFDTVLFTFTLCTVTDGEAALREARRVLKPEGRIIFCEHGIAPDASCRKWQNRLNPLWKRVSGGCNLNRPIPQLLEAGGFRLEGMTTGYWEGAPKLLGYLYEGTGTKR